MNNNHLSRSPHLSAWEQEEYILDQRTPQMLRHLSECAECRAAVEHLEQGIADFRMAAMQWSADSLQERPQRGFVLTGSWLPALRWAFAAVIPVLLLILVLVPFHSASTPQPTAKISDDALLDQVDEQVSTPVPSSMESLTHLVTTRGSAE
jgi:hypothetical protein